MAPGLVSPEASPCGLQKAAFSLCPQWAARLCVHPWSYPNPSPMGSGPHSLASLNLRDLHKGPISRYSCTGVILNSTYDILNSPTGMWETHASL